MSAFFEYLRNISYYLVFMALVGVIAPSGNYKKYIYLVTGIMFIGIVIEPFTASMNLRSIPLTELFGNIVTDPINTTDWQKDHLQEEFHSQLTDQVKALLMRNGYILISAEWETSTDFAYIERVSLITQVPEATPTPTPFIRIEPIQITPYRQAEEEGEHEEEEKKVKILLSDFYNMSIDNIHVKVV